MSDDEDVTHWSKEAKSIIEDVKKHVHQMSLSNLPSTHCRVFFNLTTLEKKDFCVEFTAEGFRVVGENYDSVDDREKYPHVHETPYSMLDSLSPAYRASFGAQLINKLNQLKDDLNEDGG
ncbi:hypothetical protein RUM43_014837 [Polyplax serrata]|uniref:GSKIP domain-containing protein n=1 Tax=Polyplax serrata TaxID=468196 RepID=A0AAN8S5X3_POLSC